MTWGTKKAPALAARRTAVSMRLRSASVMAGRYRRGDRGTLRARMSASITRARIRREILEFVRLPLPILRVGRGHFLSRNVWPDFRVFGIQQQPFLKPRIGVRLDRDKVAISPVIIANYLYLSSQLPNARIKSI